MTKKLLKFVIILVFTFIYTNLFSQITANPNAGCAPLVTQFSLNITGVASYQWNFGDGSVSNLPNPGKIYNVPGVYTITVTVNLAGGGSQTFTANNLVQVFDKPNASFTAVSDTGAVCDFTQTFRFLPNNNAAVSYLWDFGNGSASILRSPSYTYTSNGTYKVFLLLTDANGCQQVDSLNVRVQVRRPVMADFSVSDTNLCRPDFPVHVQNQSGGGQGNVVYSWQLNGFPVNNAQSTGFNFQPNTFGNHQITLIARSNQSCYDTITRTVNFTKKNLFGNVTVSDSLICAGTRVTFTMNGSLGTYTWRFGNRLTTGNPVNHTFNSAGSFGYAVYGTDNLGCTDTLTRDSVVAVISGLSVDLSGTRDPGCAYPVRYQFTGTRNGGLNVGYQIFRMPSNQLIGSGIDSIFAFSFQSQGLYRVRFFANAGVCQVADSMDINLTEPLPTFSVSSSINAGCIPLQVQFSMQHTLPAGISIQSAVWHFGNGQTSNNIAPMFTYNQSGAYQPFLRVLLNNGCRQDIYIMDGVQAGTKPTAAYGPPFVSGCNPLLVRFQNNSIDTFTYTTYQWIFNGEVMSTESNPRITFRIPTIYNGSLVVNNYGCTDTFNILNNIEVLPPLAAFASPNRRGCDTPHVVQFVDQSVGATTWFWDFGDPASGSANFSTLQNPTHQYNNTGVYTIKLIVTNANGCIDSVTRERFVTITKPVAAFTPNQATGCFPLNVSFTNHSTAGTYAWRFGNGQNSTLFEPTATYHVPGNYIVRLILNDNNGCADTAFVRQPIKVLGPTIRFRALDTAGCAPFVAQFIDSTNVANNVVRYSWDFGDPTTQSDTSNLPNPVYAYNQTGTYSVRLTVLDTSGCTASLVKNNYIQVFKPIVSFATLDTVRCIGRPARFTSQVSQARGAVSYRWDFGDGTISTQANPNKSYQQAGQYTVKLVIVDSAGCSDSMVRNLYISVITPQIVMNGSPRTGFCAPHPVQFTDSTPFARTWSWDFGDGTTSSQRNPTKIYTRNGVYSVRLIVGLQGGCSDTITVDSMIRIFGPIANYQINQINNCAPAIVQFTNLSRDFSTLTWDFGNGTIQNGLNPIYSYPNPGIFNPILIATDTSGCQDVYDPRPGIRVDSVPVAQYLIDLDSACSTLTANFTDSSLGNPVSWQWWVNAAIADTTPNFTKQFGIGVHPIQLIVTNMHGCSDTLNKTEAIRVFAPPVANFVANQPTGCLPHTVTFSDSSNGAQSIVKWSWNFGNPLSGNANVSNIQNPSHVYNRNGKFDVYLKIEDQKGCVDSIVKPEYIVIFDSVPPKNTAVELVTVVGQRLSVRWKSSDLMRFAQYKLYKKYQNGNDFQLVYTSNNRFDTLFIDNQVQVNDYSYCYYLLVEDYCGRTAPLDSNNIHCSILLDAKPASQAFVNGIDVVWNHYRGWTPSSYKIYRRLNGATQFVLLAEIPGNENKYTDRALCDAQNAYFVEAISFSSLVSTSNTDAARPNYFVNNAPVNIVRVTVENDKHVRVIWNKSPSSNVIRYGINKIYDNGSSRIRNVVVLPPTDTTWVDTRTDAHEQWYQYEVYEVDSCGNQTPLGSIGRSIHLTSRKEQFDIFLDWSAYVGWQDGVGSYQIERMNEAEGKWEFLAEVSGNVTQYQVVYENTNLPQYIYRIIGFRRGFPNIQSLSNTSREILPTTIFAPNAFTPNGDGKNDFFEIKGLHLKDFELFIFDRWGQQIFASNSVGNMWDGTVNGEPGMPGTYVWMLKIKGFDRREEFMKGAVHLLR